MLDPAIASLPFLTRDMLAFGQESTFTLIVDVLATDTNPFQIRGFTRAGFFTLLIEPTSTQALQTFTFSIPDIPVSLSVVADPTSSTSVIHHVTVHLGVATNRITLLCAGLVSSFFGISWPVQQLPTAAQTDGDVCVITGRDRAAGSEINEAVPAAQSWEVLSAIFTLVTDATVANRTVNIQFIAGDGAILTRQAGTVQTASQTMAYHCILGGTNTLISAGTDQEVAFPARIWLAPGASIITVTTNFQAGDDWGPTIYTVRRRFQPSTLQTLLV